MFRESLNLLLRQGERASEFLGEAPDVFSDRILARTITVLAELYDPWKRTPEQNMTPVNDLWTWDRLALLTGPSVSVIYYSPEERTLIIDALIWAGYRVDLTSNGFRLRAPAHWPAR